MKDALIIDAVRTPIGRYAGALASRADQDAFALRSQHRAAAAQANGRLAKEIVLVVIAQRKGRAARA